jgi:uncharacterized membrane protein
MCVSCVCRLLAACWRCQLMFLLLLLPAAVEYWRMSEEDRDKVALLGPVMPIASGTTRGIAVCFWVVALRYISTTAASLFVNSRYRSIVCLQ